MTEIQLSTPPQALPPQSRKVFIYHCKHTGCRYAATARRDGAALMGISAHIIHAHGLQVIPGGKAQ